MKHKQCCGDSCTWHGVVHHKAISLVQDAVQVGHSEDRRSCHVHVVAGGVTGKAFISQRKLSACWCMQHKVVHDLTSKKQPCSKKHTCKIRHKTSSTHMASASDKCKRSWLPNSKQLWVSNTHVKHVSQIKSKPCFQQHTCNISSQGHGCLCKNYIRFTCVFRMYHNHKNFEK